MKGFVAAIPNDTLVHVMSIQYWSKAYKVDRSRDLLDEPVVERDRVGNCKAIVDMNGDDEEQGIARGEGGYRRVRRHCPASDEDRMICLATEESNMSESCRK